MQEKTATDRKPQGKRSAYEPTPEDVVGMLEAGLDELSRHFHYDATNTAGGVRLTISGVERVDESDGTWHLQPASPDPRSDGIGTMTEDRGAGCESAGESSEGEHDRAGE